MEVISNSTSETKDVAKRIAQTAVPGNVYALYGDLGSGKTTFTSFFVDALGIDARVQSPTFVIARHYKKSLAGDIKEVIHLDLYRLASKDEVINLDLHEIFNKPNAITIIEWPEIAEDLLPSNTKKIYFEDKGENKRCIKY